MLAAGAVLAACAPRPFETATATLPRPRYPDAVHLEPQGARPVPVLHAPAAGVVTLAPPLSNEALLAVAHTFLGAFSGRGAAFAVLLSEDASGIRPASSSSRAQLLQSWELRRKQLDYSAISETDLPIGVRMDRFGFDDLGAAPAPARPLQMRAADQLVRLPIRVVRDLKSGDRLFSDVLLLLVRVEGTRLSIAGVAEYDLP